MFKLDVLLKVRQSLRALSASRLQQAPIKSRALRLCRKALTDAVDRVEGLQAERVRATEDLAAAADVQQSLQRSHTNMEGQLRATHATVDSLQARLLTSAEQLSDARRYGGKLEVELREARLKRETTAAALAAEESRGREAQRALQDDAQRLITQSEEATVRSPDDPVTWSALSPIDPIVCHLHCSW